MPYCIISDVINKLFLFFLEVFICQNNSLTFFGFLTSNCNVGFIFRGNNKITDCKMPNFSFD